MAENPDPRPRNGHPRPRGGDLLPRAGHPRTRNGDPLTRNGDLSPRGRHPRTRDSHWSTRNGDPLPRDRHLLPRNDHPRTRNGDPLTRGGRLLGAFRVGFRGGFDSSAESCYRFPARVGVFGGRDARDWFKPPKSVKATAIFQGPSGRNPKHKPFLPRVRPTARTAAYCVRSTAPHPRHAEARLRVNKPLGDSKTNDT